MVQQWRKAMLARKGDKNLNENVNDQSLFNQVVRGNELEGAPLIARAEPGRRSLLAAPSRRPCHASQPKTRGR